MAYTYTQDTYDTGVVKPTAKRVPQPGDLDYVAPAGDPNAPLPTATTTATSSTGATTQTAPPYYVPPEGGFYNPPENNSPEPPLTPAPPPEQPAYAGGGPGGFQENGIYYNQEDATKYGGTYVDPTASGKTAPLVDNSVDGVITRSLQAAYGRAPTQADLDYWRNAWSQWGSKDPAYFEQRLLGMGAGGADAALYGKYAGGTGGGTGGTFQGGNFGLADLSGIGAGGPSYGGRGTDADPNVDPFATMGGGVYANGGWLPRDRYTAEQLAAYDAQKRATTTPTPTPGAPATAGGITQDTLDQARNAAILEMLQRKPPTAESLRDTPENQAYQLQAQRAYERDRAGLAEGAQAGGYNDTGFFNTELSGLAQKRGEGEANFLGQLAITRIQAQREDLQYAIDQARNSGQFDKAQALQREAMALDASLRREQMKSTESMAANDLALREFLGRAGLDLDKLRLTQQGQQFLDQLALSYDQLGFNYAQLKTTGNAQAVSPYT